MNQPTLFLYLAGIAHFGILIASAMAPRALRWNTHLAPLPPLLRQMFWVYGIFIVMMIFSFGILTICFVDDLAGGTPMGRALSTMIALFWGTRLFVQLFIFDAKPWLTNPFYRIGYHSLTACFIYLTIIYIWSAAAP